MVISTPGAIASPGTWMRVSGIILLLLLGAVRGRKSLPQPPHLEPPSLAQPSPAQPQLPARLGRGHVTKHPAGSAGWMVAVDVRAHEADGDGTMRRLKARGLVSACGKCTNAESVVAPFANVTAIGCVLNALPPSSRLRSSSSSGACLTGI